MSNNVLSKRTYQKDGFTVVVKRVLDYDRRPELEPENYKGLPQADIDKYTKQDQERIDAYDRDEWQYVGIVVEIRKQTESNWANGGLEVGRASAWGFESDMGEDEFVEEEKNITEEAWDEVERLKKALLSETSKQPVID